MKNILIVSGHTDLNNSVANKGILTELTCLLPQAKFTYLDKLYPNYIFDIGIEQQKLIDADLIVLQFPIFWYSVPSIMKKWIEDVFVHGFSHGSTGTKLHGKKIIMSFTTGAAAELYKQGKSQNYTIDQFMPPLKQFVNLCGMKWQDYVYTGGVSYTDRSDDTKLAQIHTKATDHANRLVKQINKIIN